MPSQTQSPSQPLFLSPALPTELLWHIIHHCSHPTTLLVCSTRAEFLSSVAQHIRSQRQQQQQQPTAPPAKDDTTTNQVFEGPIEARGDEPPPPPPPPLPEPPEDDDASSRTALLLAAPLYQVAVARHIRVAFIPTVSHLRAFLSVFSVSDTKVSAPPTGATTASSPRAPPPLPLLLVYGFLGLHRDTSEWSVQGISNTAAVLVETATRVGFQAVLVEERTEGLGTDELLAERMPLLSGTARRIGPDFESGGWMGRTVDARRVLQRWFRFQPGEWDRNRTEHTL